MKVTYAVTQVAFNESRPNDEIVMNVFDNVKAAIISCENLLKQNNDSDNFDYIVVVEWE